MSATRTGLQQARTYVLLSLYLILAMVPLTAALLIAAPGSITAWTAPWLAVLAIQCVAAALTIRALCAHELDGVPIPRWHSVLLGAATLAGAALAVVVLPDGRGFGSATASLAPVAPLLAVLLVALFALTPRLTAPRLTAASVLIAALLTGASILAVPDTARSLADRLVVSLAVVFVPTVLIGAGVLLSTRWSLTILWAVRDQEQMDALRADLAVADERLRIARDLHDVFGRTLTAVAVKSDLAAALAEAGRVDRAAAESRGVRALADDALREVRGILAGYRAPDLSAEVAGARGLLDSAGTRVRVIGDPSDIPSWAVEPFARVVRETATNVVRHSDASTATVRLGVDPDGSAVLTVRNDGVERGPSDGPPAGAGGSGLEGLDARLRGLGGSLVAQSDPPSFTVVARIPPPRAQGVALVDERDDQDEGGRTGRAPEEDA